MNDNVSDILFPDNEPIDMFTIIGLCLSEHIDINTVKDPNGDTLLHVAVKNHNIDVVYFLLNKIDNVDAEILNNSYELPMDIAIKKGYSDILLLFLKKNININQSRPEGVDSFLHIAVKFKRLEIVEILCCFGANVDVRCTFGVEQGFTPFMLASKLGDTAILMSLRNKGADINAESYCKTTALYIAVEENHVDIVKLLLEWGANTEVVNTTCVDRGFTPLHVACRNGNETIVKLLVERKKVGVYARAWKGKTPLHVSIEYQHFEIFRFLLYNGANPEALYDNWQDTQLTPLHLVCTRKNHMMVYELLSKKVHMNPRSGCGETPLFLAILNGNLMHAQILLARGARVDDDKMATTLTLEWRYPMLVEACHKQLPIVVKLLLSNYYEENQIGPQWTPANVLPVMVFDKIVRLARDPETKAFYNADQIKELFNISSRENPSSTPAEIFRRTIVLHHLREYLEALRIIHQ